MPGTVPAEMTLTALRALSNVATPAGNVELVSRTIEGALTVMGVATFSNQPLTVESNLSCGGGSRVRGALSSAIGVEAYGDVRSTGGRFVGDGSGLTTLDAGAVASGALAVAYGGTGATGTTGALGSLNVLSSAPTLSNVSLQGTARITSNLHAQSFAAFTNDNASAATSSLCLRPDATCFISAVTRDALSMQGDNPTIPGLAANARPLYLYGSNITYDSRFAEHIF